MNTNQLAVPAEPGKSNIGKRKNRVEAAAFQKVKLYKKSVSTKF